MSDLTPIFDPNFRCDELGAWGDWHPATATEYEQCRDDLLYRFREVRAQQAAAPGWHSNESLIEYCTRLNPSAPGTAKAPVRRPVQRRAGPGGRE